LVDVDLHKSKKGEFIEITIEPYPYPVNYKGQYHYRPDQQTGMKVPPDKFLYRKLGIAGTGSVPKSQLKIKQDTFDFFVRRLLKSKD
jgi:ATP-dependent DNA helicase RecG